MNNVEWYHMERKRLWCKYYLSNIIPIIIASFIFSFLLSLPVSSENFIDKLIIIGSIASMGDICFAIDFYMWYRRKNYLIKPKINEFMYE